MATITTWQYITMLETRVTALSGYVAQTSAFHTVIEDSMTSRPFDMNQAIHDYDRVPVPSGWTLLTSGTEVANPA